MHRCNNWKCTCGPSLQISSTEHKYNMKRVILSLLYKKTDCAFVLRTKLCIQCLCLYVCSHVCTYVIRWIYNLCSHVIVEWWPNVRVCQPPSDLQPSTHARHPWRNHITQNEFLASKQGYLSSTWCSHVSTYNCPNKPSATSSSSLHLVHVLTTLSPPSAVPAISPLADASQNTAAVVPCKVIQQLLTTIQQLKVKENWLDLKWKINDYTRRPIVLHVC